MARDLNTDSRQRQVDAFLRYSTVGLMCFLVWMIADLTTLHQAQAAVSGKIAQFTLISLPALGLGVSILQLFRLRKSDEFVEHLWSAGTSAAFITTLVASIVLGFAVGSAVDFNVLRGPAPDVLRRVEPFLSNLSLLAFFGAMQSARFRSA